MMLQWFGLEFVSHFINPLPAWICRAFPFLPAQRADFVVDNHTMVSFSMSNDAAVQ